MSVLTTYSPPSYTGDGVTTSFPFPFEFQAASDLVVQVTVGGVASTKVLGVDYSVSGVGAYAGGAVNFVTAPAVGAGVTISRATAVTQPVSLVTQGAFYPSSVEAGLDRVTLVDQEQASAIAAIKTKQTTDEASLASLLTTVSAMSGGTYVPNLAPFSQTLVPGGRLTLLSGTPVTPIDQAAATNIFYTPQKHTLVPIYNGTSWNYYVFSELSQPTTDTTKSPAAVVANKCYDMFVWNDGGTLRCTRGPAWSSDTLRGTGAGTTELVSQDGRMVNKWAITNGPVASCGLYVGTVRSDGSSKLNDTAAKRHAWNTHNRVARSAIVQESTSNWTPTGSGAWRQANGNAANQFDLVRGLDEDAVSIRAISPFQFSNGNMVFYAGIGLDSASGIVAGSVSGIYGMSGVGDGDLTIDGAAVASYCGMPGIGRHFLAWLENSSTTNGLLFGLGSNSNGGLIGTVFA